MVKVEGVSQQWCNQFGARVLAKLSGFYYNNPELSLDTFISKEAVSMATGPVSFQCATLFNFAGTFDYCATIIR